MFGVWLVAPANLTGDERRLVQAAKCRWVAFITFSDGTFKLGGREAARRIRESAILSLATINSPSSESRELLVSALQDARSSTRIAAAKTLGVLDPNAVLRSLDALLLDQDEAVRIAALWSANHATGHVPVPVLLSALPNCTFIEHVEIVKLLSKANAEDLPNLIDGFRSSDKKVRKGTIEAVLLSGEPRFVEIVRQLLQDPIYGDQAIRFVGNFGADREAIEVIEKSLFSDWGYTRREAAAAIRKLAWLPTTSAASAAVAVLLESYQHLNTLDRSEVCSALRREMLDRSHGDNEAYPVWLVEFGDDTQIETLLEAFHLGGESRKRGVVRALAKLDTAASRATLCEMATTGQINFVSELPSLPPDIKIEIIVAKLRSFSANFEHLFEEPPRGQQSGHDLNRLKSWVYELREQTREAASGTKVIESLALEPSERMKLLSLHLMCTSGRWHEPSLCVLLCEASRRVYARTATACRDAKIKLRTQYARITIAIINNTARDLDVSDKDWPDSMLQTLTARSLDDPEFASSFGLAVRQLNGCEGTTTYDRAMTRAGLILRERLTALLATRRNALELSVKQRAVPDNLAGVVAIVRSADDSPTLLSVLQDAFQINREWACVRFLLVEADFNLRAIIERLSDSTPLPLKSVSISLAIQSCEMFRLVAALDRMQSSAPRMLDEMLNRSIEQQLSDSMAGKPSRRDIQQSWANLGWAYSSKVQDLVRTMKESGDCLKRELVEELLAIEDRPRSTPGGYSEELGPGSPINLDPSSYKLYASSILKQ